MTTGSTDPPRWPPGLDEGFRERFELVAQLGAGTFGAVFRARDRSLDRPVVVKVLRLEHGEDPALVERFRREAEAMARLSHPRVVPLLDHGQAGECHYLIAPDLGGRALEDELRGALPLEPRAASQILGEVLEGLVALHAAGLVHRDLKPANILRLEDGTLALIDLGLAGIEGAGGTLTSTGQVIGTPGYISPEQIRGGAASSSSDLYAVGVLAYELLTGENPFRGRDVGESMQRHLTLEPAPPSRRTPAVPPRLSSWVLDLLEKDPEDRPASAREALEGLAEPTPGPDPLPSTGAHPRLASPPPGRRPMAAALALIAAAVMPLGWWLSSSGDVAPLDASPSPSAPSSPALPHDLAALAARELEQAFDQRFAGRRLLAEDPAEWGRNLQHLTTLSRFHAWLASGGRPELLPEETTRALRATDSTFRALGFPAPFRPYLEAPSLRPARIRVEDWSATPRFALPEDLRDRPLPGWAGEAYRLALRLEHRRRELEAKVERAVEARDREALPADFLSHMDLVRLTGRDTHEPRILTHLNSYYCTSASRRLAFVQWMGDSLDDFRRFAYCVARSLREHPEEGDRMAVLFTHLCNRLRVFIRGHTTHEPVSYALGFVPEGPRGAHLAGALLHEQLETRILLPNQEVPGPALEYWTRALAPTGRSLDAQRRLQQAAGEGIYTLSATGEITQVVADVPGLKTYVSRVLEVATTFTDSGRAQIAFLILDAYGKVVRRTLADTRTRALEDLRQLAPELLAFHPGCQDELQAIFEEAASSHPQW